MPNIEVEKQPDGQIRKPKVREQLRCVERNQPFNRLYFNYDSVLDEHIKSKPGLTAGAAGERRKNLGLLLGGIGVCD